MSEIGPKLTVPHIPVDVMKAAYIAVHAQQSVLTLLAYIEKHLIDTDTWGIFQHNRLVPVF